jgi:hypothetical protein
MRRSLPAALFTVLDASSIDWPFHKPSPIFLSSLYLPNPTPVSDIASIPRKQPSKHFARPADWRLLRRPESFRAGTRQVIEEKDLSGFPEKPANRTGVTLWQTSTHSRPQAAPELGPRTDWVPGDQRGSWLSRAPPRRAERRRPAG